VGGTATLGGTLIVDGFNPTDIKKGQTFDFLTAGGGIYGTFGNLDIADNGTLLRFKVKYGSHDVSLESFFAPFTSVDGLTPNQESVAKNLDRAMNDRHASKLVNFLGTQQITRLPGDFDKIAPEEYTSIFTLGESYDNVQSLNLQRRTDNIRSGSTGFSAAGLAMNGYNPSFDGPIQFRTGTAGPNGDDGKTSKEVKQVIPEESRWGAFLTGTGEWVGVGDDFNAKGYDIASGGFTLGVDYKLTPHLAVGVMAGYVGTTVDTNDGGRVRANGGKLGLYATAYQNRQPVAPASTGMSKDSSKESKEVISPVEVDPGWYADLAVVGGYSGYDVHRSALNGTARGDTNGGDLNVLFGGGYDFKRGGFTFGPTASFNYTYVGVGDFTETGSLAPLHFGSQGQESIRTALGIKASYDWKVGGVIVRPEFRAAWQHEYGDAAYEIDSSFANGGGSTFTVNGPRIGRDSLLVGAGFAIQINERFSTYFYYDGELARTRYDSHNVSAGVRVAF
ncbi:MAG: autotransporter outer membrane beta-barrel domain-containing protein, partial [Chthoniobacter sp.]